MRQTNLICARNKKETILTLELFLFNVACLKGQAFLRISNPIPYKNKNDEKRAKLETHSGSFSIHVYFNCTRFQNVTVKFCLFKMSPPE